LGGAESKCVEAESDTMDELEQIDIEEWGKIE
jgi:hypothetical protein